MLQVTDIETSSEYLLQILKVMKTNNKMQRHCEIWRLLAWALLIAFLWVPEKVNGNCGQSALNLTAFSLETIALVSHSWIDQGGSIRMAPPYHANTNSTINATVNRVVMGQVLYRNPVSLIDPRTNNSASFSTSFSFSVISVMQVPPATNGMAFLIIPDQSAVSTTSAETSARVSRLLDPYSVMGSNISSHIFVVQLGKRDKMSSRVPRKTSGIDDEPPAASAYSSYLEDAATNFAWIDYDAARLHLQVTVSNTSDGPKSALLSTKCDLSGVFLNTMYIGFSSRDKISINSWNFVSAGCPPLLSASTESPPSHHPPPSFEIFGSGNRSLATRHPWFCRRLMMYIGAASGCALFICLLTAGGVRNLWLVLKHRGAKSVPGRDIPFAPQIFTYRMLSNATNGFDETALLGRGGFGSVYKGIIAGGQSPTVVAVKRIESRNNAQRERQFIAEISSLGRLRHRNLVHLLGWCHEKGELLLVYDYMPNGSLDRLLFGMQERVLSFESRYSIVKGVAEALAYLHGEWEKQVVHRDVKASNVLLDSDFSPRLGDFGLARLIEHNQLPKCTSIAGTLGYLAPEISVTGNATDKTDVFSFGVFTLEVACGRRPIERTLPPQEVVLTDWVWHLHSKGEMMNVIDSKLLLGGCALNKANTLLNVGLHCSHPNPAARPSMHEVVQILIGHVPCPAVPDCKPILPFVDSPHPPIFNNIQAGCKLSSTKISGRTQCRVSNCSSI